jgi:hypothetical protein
MKENFKRRIRYLISGQLYFDNFVGYSGKGAGWQK